MSAFTMSIRYKLPFFLQTKYLRKGIVYVLSGILLVFLTHPGRFAQRYEHVSDEDIESYLVPVRAPDERSCELYPKLSSKLLDVGYVSNGTLSPNTKTVNIGGWWEPENCEAIHKVAIVIPYRDRPKQLNAFLYFMHEFLQRQLISYRIFIIEQGYGKSFNRGMLMNVGFKEAKKLLASTCFIFHDIDLLPQVLQNIYACTRLPRHLTSSINVWRYNLLYNSTFGGAISITSEQFQKINGFSNMYYGWGAEDDDLLLRIRNNDLDIIRFSPEVSRYYMLPHRPENKNPGRFEMLSIAASRFGSDGLNSLDYRVLSYENKKLYTHIVVQF